MKKESILYTVLGGIGLLVASGIVNVFFSTPPTRAEFSELKIKVISIKDDLLHLKNGQEKILFKLIEKKDEKNERTN